jgi:hypothetical protein
MRALKEWFLNWIVELRPMIDASIACVPFCDRTKRPKLIQYPKFHWEFWQSLLLGGRRSIGRPLSMVACRGGRVSKSLVMEANESSNDQDSISAYKTKVFNIAFCRRSTVEQQDHETRIIWLPPLHER